MRSFLVFAVLVLAGSAHADANSDAERAFFDLLRREAAGDSSVLEAFEALGAASPPTLWSDDAYVHAARLAEQRRDLARARNNYEKAATIAGDGRLASRARSELARLAANTGGGQWDQVAAAHERLEGDVYSGNNPKPALRGLEALIAAHPNYPRRAGVALVVAEGWEREGDAARAIDWLASTRVADPAQQRALDVALIHALIRQREIDRAQLLLQRYRASSSADPAVIRELDQALYRAQRRRWLRRLAWGLICIAGLWAAADLRRAAGSWRNALRALRRPPTEVLFLAPIAAVLAVAAATGNVLVAPAVWQILASGFTIAWISGVLLDLARTGAGAVSLWRTIAHAVTAMATLSAFAYTALDQQALLDLLRETFAHGPAMR